jgi:hypothetical protein
MATNESEAHGWFCEAVAGLETILKQFFPVGE